MDIQMNDLANASSPEEFAQQFLAAVSKGLSKVVADNLGDVINQASTASLSPQVSGWQGLIGGCCIGIDWQRPLGRPVGQVVSFAPVLQSSGAQIAGIGIDIGVSVTARF